MIRTFTALLTAHLAADFILQTEWLVAHKGQFRFLSLHVAIVAITAALAVGATTPPAAGAVAVIALTHMGLDHAKLRHLGSSLHAFAIDQLGHIAVIAAIALCMPGLGAQGWWAALPSDLQVGYYGVLTLAGGLITAVPLGGILIKKLVEALPPPSPSSTLTTGNPATSIAGMAKGGQYIGWLERALTFLFVLTGRYEAVGFLITAKSILRFGDIRHSDDRHIHEYIIIGTMLSFGWGFAAAVLTAKALGYWGLG